MYSLWEVNEIIEATGGQYQGSSNFTVDQIVTDSKKIKENNLFVAIKGKNRDASNYIVQAIDAGCSYVITQNKQYYDNPLYKEKVILVSNSEIALQALARHRRKNIASDAIVIAITGSVGKTTTKDMFSFVLSKYGKTYATYGNFNNHIGVPITLSNTPKDVKYCVLELGMNHTGEIDFLSEIVRPDISIILNIFEAHIGNFNSIAEIALAKSEIFNYQDKDGLAIINHQSNCRDILYQQATAQGIKRIDTVNDQNIRVTDIHDNIVFIEYNGQVIKFATGIYGEKNLSSFLFIFVVLDYLELDYTKFLHDFKEISNREGRGNISITSINNHQVSIIDDSYNACPSSMIVAIQSTSKWKHVILLLGDMYELGDHSCIYHTQIADTVNDAQNVLAVIAVGEYMRNMYNKLADNIHSLHYNTVTEIPIEAITDLIDRDGIAIIAKGSNGINMKHLVNLLLDYE